MTYLDPSGSQWATRNQWRTRPECSAHVRCHRVPRLQPGAVEELAKYAGVPVYNGLTDQCHPTQMLADVLTMHEASGKTDDSISYAFVGDCRSNMGRSLMVMGSLMGIDVRSAARNRFSLPTTL